MRVLCVLIASLGLLLLVWSWRGWRAAQDRHAVTQEVQQAITELQRLVQIHDRTIQPLPAEFASRLDDAVVAKRDWSIVALIGAVVFLSGLAGIVIQRRSHVRRNAA